MAAPSPALPPQPGTILGVHEVKTGETLDCIGRAYSVDPNAIAQVNGTSSPAVGQKLNIPAVAWYNTTVRACTRTVHGAGWLATTAPHPLWQHTVKQGEWIYCIARAYKVTPWSSRRRAGFLGRMAHRAGTATAGSLAHMGAAGTLALLGAAGAPALMAGAAGTIRITRPGTTLCLARR